MNKRLSKLFVTILVTAIVLSAFPVLMPAKAAPLPPSFYIVPDKSFLSPPTTVGTTFNEFLYVSTSSDTFMYQYEVDFNATQIACQSAVYSGATGSQFFAGHTTISTGPTVDNTTGTISGDETLPGSDVVPATPGGALIINMTFITLIGPPEGGSLTSLISLISLNPDNTFLLDPNLNIVTGVIYGSATYTNTCGRAIYIRADGSIYPQTAPIYSADNITYTLTGNITSDADGIWIEKDNIVLDGAGYTVQGTGGTGGTGIGLAGRANATVQNTTITAFNNGIQLYSSDNNSIAGNNITNNYYGVWLNSSSNNSIFHNNFINNTKQVYDVSWDTPGATISINIWDGNYPSGGNYWSDYTGVDAKKGPNQDEPGSDGIGDMPYAIDADNRDRYPLMYPYGSPPPNTYSLTITTTANGTTDPATGTYLYSQGQSVPVQAIPDTGYMLDHWELDGSNVGSANPYSVLMDNNHTLHSVFVPAHTLTITTTAGGTTTPPPDPHIYNVGTSVPVSAIPDTYYFFDHWELDGVNRTENPINVTMDTDHTLHAVFKTHNVAVTDVTPSQTVVAQGYSLDINVTVTNQGDYNETFYVTVYANTTSVASQNVTLEIDASTTITFTWNTTGFALGEYIISAYASQVPGETRMEDNTYIYGVVNVKLRVIHDIAVTNVSPYSNVVPEGLSLEITVSVENLGDFEETFNLTVYANTTEVQTKTISDLSPESSTTVTFTWNTNGLALGDYMMKANASVVPGETNFWNNIYVDGIVTIYLGPGTCVYVHPEVTVVEPGETFSVDVNIYNVTDLYVWQIALNYNSAILTPTGFYAPYSAYGPDYVLAAGFGSSPSETFNGSCTLCTITFQAKTEGISYLDFSPPWTPGGYWDILRRAVTFDTFLWDSTLSDIPFYVVNGEVRVVSHDIAVTSVTPSKTVVGQGYSMRINVTVANQGDFTENFNVTAYANATVIGSQNVTLSAGDFATVTFTWNTTGFAYGNYTISAYAWPVPGETNTADNNCTGGWVCVSIIGDITGGTPNLLDFVPDGKVDMKDIGVVARFFGQNAPPAPSNCDITGLTLGVPDGKIDMRDIGLVARHFGDHT